MSEKESMKCKQLVKLLYTGIYLLIIYLPKHGWASEANQAVQTVLTQLIRYPTQTLQTITALQNTIAKYAQETDPSYPEIEQISKIAHNPFHLIWPLSECQENSCAQKRSNNFRSRLFFENESARHINQSFKNVSSVTFIAFAAGGLFSTFRTLNLVSPEILSNSSLVIIDPAYEILSHINGYFKNNAAYARYTLHMFKTWFTQHRQIPLDVNIYTSTVDYLKAIQQSTADKASVVLANDYPQTACADLQGLIECGTKKYAIFTSLVTSDTPKTCCISIIEKHTSSGTHTTQADGLSQNAFLSLILPDNIFSKIYITEPFTVCMKKIIAIPQ